MRNAIFNKITDKAGQALSNSLIDGNFFTARAQDFQSMDVNIYRKSHYYTIFGKCNPRYQTINSKFYIFGLFKRGDRSKHGMFSLDSRGFGEFELDAMVLRTALNSFNFLLRLK